MQASFIQVLLPLKIRWMPFYRTDRAVEPGTAVNVVFSGREYTGIVWGSGKPGPELQENKIRDILRIRDDIPAISVTEMKLWEFMASYYLCTVGEVFKAAYPALRIRGENMYSSRIARLRQRAEKLRAQLSRRHREDIRLRLEESLRAVEAVLECHESMPQLPTAPAAAAPQPLLIQGNDRTDRYRMLARQALSDNRQVLVLTPEIAFCNRMAEELGHSFGQRLYCVNADRSAGYRQSVSGVLRSGSPAVVVGTRSSVFLPFTRLGLVIIDEEQDSSYKQEDPAPRYNARDTAVFLASIHGAAAVLGSALPSLESLLNVRNGKYSCEYTGRHGADPAFIDIRAEKRKNGMLGPISRKLVSQIHSAGCRVLLLRGWEDRQELDSRVSTLFPDDDVCVTTLSELKRLGPRGAGIIAVLQIEAFCPSDDFRSDERALQTVAMLGGLAPRVIVQTSMPEKFAPERGTDALLEERREFSFPPYTRLVEIRKREDGSTTERHFLPKDSTLQQRKAMIAETVPEDCYVDVDPI